MRSINLDSLPKAHIEVLLLLVDRAIEQYESATDQEKDLQNELYDTDIGRVLKDLKKFLYYNA